MLPLMCGSIVATVLPVVYLILKQSIAASDANNFSTVAASLILLMPLMISGAMGPAMARFDPVRPTGDLPVYISSRPMTNGGFVVTKLAVTLIASVVTWLVMAGIGIVSLFCPNWTDFAGRYLPYGWKGASLGCIPAFLLLIIMTWNNLVSGMAAGLTGRPWIIGLFPFAKALVGMALFGVVIAAKFDSDFKHRLLQWLLPGILVVCLTTKLVLSVGEFSLGFASEGC